MKKTWFSAKCLFVHRDRGDGPRQLYEERVVLVRAPSFRKAMKLAEREANEYARVLTDCSYTGYIDVFQLYDEPADGVDVYSGMTQSDLIPESYIDRFYPPEPEDCETAGREHRYYKKGHGHSACYHCSVVKPGKLWK